MAKKTTPTPIAVTTICSVCGLGWELHGADPTTDDCIRLLKAELSRRPIYSPVTIRPYTTQPYPYWPYHQPTWISTQGGSWSGSSAVAVNTPRTITGTCSSVTP